jgi:hypothetical protein
LLIHGKWWERKELHSKKPKLWRKNLRNKKRQKLRSLQLKVVKMGEIAPMQKLKKRFKNNQRCIFRQVPEPRNEILIFVRQLF